MNIFNTLEMWFVVGSQHLYGPKTLQQVEEHARQIVAGLNETAGLPIRIVLKPVVKTSDEILALCREANHADHCAGLITWMHTFSPAKMWIGGLTRLEKPFLQFHTQFNAEIPWANMDMAFMNLNQTAHGDREFGFVGARLRLPRTVVVGHWQNADCHREIGEWMRVTAAVWDSRHLKIARFGDNMRDVAVTEGDKVEAQIRFGYQVNGYALGQLAERVDAVSEADINTLIDEYEATYQLTAAVQANGEKRQHLRDAAAIELGIKGFLEQGGFNAFTTTFENLYGLKQLPGLAVQRLMQQGYGFGAEGDWKTAALLRSAKVMGHGQPGGASFMEDYTYHFQPGNDLVLGAHMLEVCPSISQAKAVLDVQPLSIGKKADPARLIFAASAGPARNATLIDLGNRFRLLVNELDVIDPPHALPELPTAHAVWKPLPDLNRSAQAWILAGGAHHAVFSQAVSANQWRTFAELMGIEFLAIDERTEIPAFKNEINWNEVFFSLKK
ncbi:L-arabinose isomerase [Andreprevotia chitinilytica]|uniref:L-arabinose isomerase n=1 Tax=Andreprevotia chitinilytica TaxID=396808 RepID=UPI0005576575|nr:L-arabinose isomerase [Andreprevotia chitinilytica]